MMIGSPDNILPLTTDCAVLLVRTVSAPIPARAHDGRGPASTVCAPHGTVQPLSIPFVAEQTHEECRHCLRTAKMCRLVATIATRNNCVTELVLGQTFPASTLESSLWTLTPQCGVASEFVFAPRTLHFSVAHSRP